MTIIKRFGLGCRFDTPHRKKLYKPALGPSGLFKTSPTLVSGTTSLAEYEALALDQGQTGSCEGHSSTMATWMGFLAAATPLPWFPSPDGLYRDSRCQARVPNSDGTLPALTDDGAMTSDVVTVMQTCGLRPMIGPTSDGRNSDVDPSTVNNEPTLDQLDTEAETPVLVNPNAYIVDLSDTKVALAVIQAALKQKLVARIDIFCDTAFQNYFTNWTSSTKPLDSCNLNDPNGGGHAIVMSEIAVTSALSVTLSGLNSWGPLGAPALVPTGCMNAAGHWQGDANWFAQAVQQVTVWNVQKVAA